MLNVSLARARPFIRLLARPLARKVENLEGNGQSTFGGLGYQSDAQATLKTR
jgi:hypothetical protein